MEAVNTPQQENWLESVQNFDETIQLLWKQKKTKVIQQVAWYATPYFKKRTQKIQYRIPQNKS